MDSENPLLNKVNNRFLKVPPSVESGLEHEAKLSDFEILKELGCGTFGKVYLVNHKITGAQYALKAIDKKNQNNIEEKTYFNREIEIMYKVHHPNIVKIFGHFEDNRNCYFIMEYVPKGNLYELIPKDKKKKLPLQKTAAIIKDVVSATYFLHNMNPIIIHRDIKPENILMGENGEAKLTDFGWSNYMEGQEKRLTTCGTPLYLAPEMIEEKGHDEKVDNWCIGVLLFELLTGNVPFAGNDLNSLKKNISELKITWPKVLNTNGKNLISKILKIDPKSRVSLDEILQHPFITEFFPDAAKSLIKPDNSIKYKPFIVSKDDPKTWNPIE